MLRDGSVLCAHPDLCLVEAANEHVGLTLLGFAVDPFHPDRTDRDVLEALLRRLGSPADAPVAAQDIGGRWVLIAHAPQEAILFADPCGLREVYYTTAEDGERWCASQSGHIASELRLPLDEETQRAFAQSPYFAQHAEPWWPGDASPYAAIRHLPPNHFLQLRTGRRTRFWPHSELVRLPFEEAAQIASSRLRNVVEAAGRRFALSLPLTAGMDSRTILAASRHVPDLYYFSMKLRSLSTRSPDVRIPARLLRGLALSHDTIDCTGEPDDDFAELFRENADTAPEASIRIANGIYRGYPSDRVWLSGHCSEVARCTNPLRRQLSSDLATAEDFSRFAEMDGNDFATGQFDRWLGEASDVAGRCGVLVPDLFEWEQWYGRWAAAGQSKWDIVCERMTPFNCRAVLEPLLGVDIADRSFDTQYAVFREMIRLLWPELLEHPFNPPYTPLRQRARGAVVSVLEHTGTRPAARRARSRLRGTHHSA